MKILTEHTGNRSKFQVVLTDTGSVAFRKLDRYTGKVTQENRFARKNAGMALGIFNDYVPASETVATLVIPNN